MSTCPLRPSAHPALAACPPPAPLCRGATRCNQVPRYSVYAAAQWHNHSTPYLVRRAAVGPRIPTAVQGHGHRRSRSGHILGEASRVWSGLERPRLPPDFSTCPSFVPLHVRGRNHFHELLWWPGHHARVHPGCTHRALHRPRFRPSGRPVPAATPTSRCSRPAAVTFRPRLALRRLPCSYPAVAMKNSTGASTSCQLESAA